MKHYEPKHTHNPAKTLEDSKEIAETAVHLGPAAWVDPGSVTTPSATPSASKSRLPLRLNV